jgi:SAM-dependent methyltransferase
MSVIPAEAASVPRFQTPLPLFRALGRRAWTEAAPGWRAWTPQLAAQSRAATAALLEAAGPAPGQHVLDLASGTGDPAFALAAAVGPGGRVTATDLVPGMLVAAAHEAGRRGLANVGCQVADSEALPFADRTADRVTCRFGACFFPDPVAALREARRVLRPGGRAVLVSWGPPEGNPWYGSTVGVLTGLGAGPWEAPDPETPGPFRFARPGALAAALRAAGFARAAERTRVVPWPWPGSPEECRAQALDAVGVRRLLARLPPERRDRALADALAAIRARYDGQRVQFEATIVVAWAER